MALHSIRLAGPWEEVIPENAAPAKTQLPYTIPEDTGCVILRRRFHRPSGLGDNSRVHISVKAPRALSEIRLNDERVTRMDDSEIPDGTRSLFDVTSHLAAFNTLDVQLDHNVRKLTAVVLEIVEPVS